MVVIRTGRILKHSDRSDPDSIGPSIPLTNLIFDYHLVVKALTNLAASQPLTPSVQKTTFISSSLCYRSQR